MMTTLMSRDSCDGQFVLMIQSHNNTFVETQGPGPSLDVSLLINQTAWSISIICGYLSLVTIEFITTSERFLSSCG